VEVVELHFAYGEHQLVAVGKVQVDRWRRDSYGVGDGPNGQRGFVAGLDKQMFGGAEDFFAQAFALPPPGTGPAGGRAF
jgi:hypothetical protein